MIRKFKALGLALVAVLAMSVVVASAAQAAPKVTITAGATVSAHATGVEIGEEFKIDGVGVTCKVSHYTSTVENNGETIRVTPTYTECKVGEAIPAVITTHECHYLFHLTEKVAENVFKAHADVECTNSKKITIVSTNPKCIMEVGSQTNLTTGEITNNAAKTDVEIKPNVTGITGTVVEDGFLCPFTSTGVKTGGTYKTEKPLTATAASGTIQISGS